MSKMKWLESEPEEGILDKAADEINFEVLSVVVGAGSIAILLIISAMILIGRL